MKWNNQSITPVADFPTEIKKNSAASPDIEEEPKKSLHPERTDAERLAQIDSLKALTDKVNYKKESILPPWPTTTTKSDEYGPTLNYD